MLIILIGCKREPTELLLCFFEKIFEPAPFQDIKDGKLLHRNVRKELITKDELIANRRKKTAWRRSAKERKRLLKAKEIFHLQRKKLLPKKKLIFKKTPPLFSWRGQYLV